MFDPVVELVGAERIELVLPREPLVNLNRSSAGSRVKSVAKPCPSDTIRPAGDDPRRGKADLAVVADVGTPLAIARQEVGVAAHHRGGGEIAQHAVPVVMPQ